MVYPIIYRLSTIHSVVYGFRNHPRPTINWSQWSFCIHLLLDETQFWVKPSPSFCCFFSIRTNMLVNTIAMTDGRQFPHWLSPLYHFRSFSPRDGLERTAQQVSPLWLIRGVPKMGGIPLVSMTWIFLGWFWDILSTIPFSWSVQENWPPIWGW